MYNLYFKRKLIRFGSYICLLIVLFPKFSTESQNVPFADESFRRLESGENSEEIVNQCCRRETNFVTVGYGLDDTEVRVDIGQCRQVCEKPAIKPLRRDEFDKYLKKYPSMDPVQIFLALQSRVTPTGVAVGSIEQDEMTSHHSSTSRQLSMSMSTSSKACVAATCHPNAIRREIHFGLTGEEKEIEVVETCDCIKVPQECQRVSRPVRFHVGTPYEKVLDVGQCMGPCVNDDDADDDDTSEESDLNCRPVRNRTVTIDGPNGAQCMQVIDECQCTGNCFRIREFFKVFDYSNVFASLESSRRHGSSSHGGSGNGSDSMMGDQASMEDHNDTLITNEVGVLSQNPVIPINGGSGGISDEPDVTLEPLTKVIDIGRCSGSCSDGRVTSKCLAWSPGTNGTCISTLYGGRIICSPTKFVTHSYTDKKGHRHNVVSVISCGCR